MEHDDLVVAYLPDKVMPTFIHSTVLLKLPIFLFAYCHMVHALITLYMIWMRFIELQDLTDRSKNNQDSIELLYLE